MAKPELIFLTQQNMSSPSGGGSIQIFTSSSSLEELKSFYSASQSATMTTTPDGQHEWKTVEAVGTSRRVRSVAIRDASTWATSSLAFMARTLPSNTRTVVVVSDGFDASPR